VGPWLGHAQLLNAILSENYLAVAFWAFLAFMYFFLGKSIRLLILLVPAEYYVDIYASDNAQEEQPHEKRNSSLYPSVRILRNVNRR
jgi:hypothetical protein